MKTLSVSKIVGFFPLRKNAGGWVEAILNGAYPARRSSSARMNGYDPSDGSGARQMRREIYPLQSILTPLLDALETARSQMIMMFPMSMAYGVRPNALFAPGCHVVLYLFKQSPLKSLSGAVAGMGVNGGGVCLAQGLVTHTTNDFGETDTGLRLYPNPASSTTLLQLDALLPEGRLDVFNTDGRLVLRMSISDPLTPLDLSGWPNGMYVLRYGNDRTAVVKHVIKQ